MEKEREELLRNILEKGVKISNVFPYKYHGKRVYYDIHFPEPKLKLVVVVERKAPSSREKQFELKIVEIFQYVCGEKEVLRSTLSYNYLKFETNQPFFYSNAESPVCLSGKMYLLPKGKKEEVF